MDIVGGGEGGGGQGMAMTCGKSSGLTDKEIRGQTWSLQSPVRCFFGQLSFLGI